MLTSRPPVHRIAHAITAPLLRPGDRLGLMLIAATAVHAILILGISFDAAKRNRSDNTALTLDVTLVHSRSERPPEEADALAQSNQRGGGNVQERVRSSSPLPFVQDTDESGVGLQNRQAVSPASEPTPEQPPLLESHRGKTRVTMARPEPTPRPDSLDAGELIERSREIARLSTEIRQRQQQYARMVRERTLSANTREYKYASYMDAWRMKVERIGNLNYPEEAKRQNLSGSLIVDVALNPDGSLYDVEVLRSSGYKVLDDAAVRIVELGAPYAPFPRSFRDEVDRLHIVRTWQFQSDHRLETSR